MSDTSVRFCDEFSGVIGWIHPEPRWMLRAGHAVLSGGRVWVIDPPAGAGVLERITALGEPAGVVQLLDRHNRDCAAFAEQLGVPLHRVPFDGVEGAPFTVVPILRTPMWKEAALWFPAEGTLVCADALAAAPGYTARRERVGVHPFLRAFPPRQLAHFDVQRLLLGHGEGLDGPQALTAVAEALRTARRNIPAVFADSLRLGARR